MMIEPITLLGYLAALCTTLSFVPQVIHTLRTQDTSAISLGMYSLFVFGICLWLVYGVYLGEKPIIIANIVTIGLASCILGLKIRDVLSARQTNQ